MESPDHLLVDVIERVKKVGRFISEEFNRFDRRDIRYKGLNDLVSYVDTEAEKKLVEELSPLLPEAGFLTEEKTVAHELSDTFWIIDPLDGTTNFIHGIPVFAVSVALMHKKDLLLGIVYEINRDECFYAQKGGGAFCNGRPVSVSGIGTLKESLIATGFPYQDFEGMEAYLRILNRFMQSTHGLRRAGSAAVDLAYVACGRFEGFFEYNLSPWDVAGGALIVKEAGGTVSDFEGGDDYVFGKQIIASGAVHSSMMKIIQKERKGI